jgi:hypothetical protein
MLVPRAQLKVFSPLEAFPPHERERWQTYVDEGRGLSRREMVAVEAGTALTRLISGRPRLGEDAALVRRVGRRQLICPLQLDLRAAVALDSFRRTVPPAAFEAFVPDPRGAARLAELTASGHAPHVLDEAWVVPLHWFVAFEPGDRRLTDPPEGTGPRMVHLTAVERALERLDHAIEVVERTLEDGEDVLADLASLSAWLDTFDPTSLLELDYGGVARTFSRDELLADHTCEELWRAVEALESGDLLGAAAAYGMARARWSDRRAKQHAS